jgi:hypothetical protein
VERELFLELLSHVGRKVRLRDYLYIGFGGPFFEDFKSVHSRLGIKEMLSIEKDDWVYKRQQNNIPYGIVKCRQLDSKDLVQNISVITAEFPTAKHLLCWLDYASPRQLGTQLGEIRTLLPKLSRYDVVKVTFNANPSSLGELPLAEQGGPDAPERKLQHRLDKLRARLGAAFPGDVEPADVQPDNYPALLLRILQLQISESMRENPLLMFQPLGCYVYADSEHQMLTCTGILLKHTEVTAFIRATSLKKLDFGSLDWETRKIDVPYLSAREKLLLDRKMFNNPAAQIVDDDGLWFDEDKDRSVAMIGDYERFYRFYPHYHRIQY